jgi:hypothetical protein
MQKFLLYDKQNFIVKCSGFSSTPLANENEDTGVFLCDDDEYNIVTNNKNRKYVINSNNAVEEYVENELEINEKIKLEDAVINQYKKRNITILLDDIAKENGDWDSMLSARAARVDDNSEELISLIDIYKYTWDLFYKNEYNNFRNLLYSIIEYTKVKNLHTITIETENFEQIYLTVINMQNGTFEKITL